MKCVFLICLVSFNVFAGVNPLSNTDHLNHLEPCTSRFLLDRVYWQWMEEAMMSKNIEGEYGRPLLDMFFLSPFSTEVYFAMFQNKTTKEYMFHFASPERNFQFLLREYQRKAESTDYPDVHIKRIVLDCPQGLGEVLHDLWVRMLLRTRYPSVRPRLLLDAPVYIFRVRTDDSRELYGESKSATEGSVELFKKVARLLIRYCEVDKQIYRDDIVKELYGLATEIDSQLTQEDAAKLAQYNSPGDSVSGKPAVSEVKISEGDAGK